MDRIEGVYLPLITPFHEGAVDYESLRRLIEHYSSFRLAGLVLLGTTGESPTVEEGEQAGIVDAALDATADALPIYVGVSGNASRHVARSVDLFETRAIAGYLVVTPYYNRPAQDGLIEHFRVVAAATERPTIVYNVPYRTGVNLSNEALIELATTVPNVRAVKDSTGNVMQSLELLRIAPDGLAVLTGEDPLFFTSLANGGAGGILASSHLATETFISVAEAVAADEVNRARQAWFGIAGMIPTLFAESNPMPLKYCLWRLGLIRSPECRLPLTTISKELAAKLDEVAGYAERLADAGSDR